MPATWTNPKTYSAATLTSAEKNTYERDNLLYLKSIKGAGALYIPTLTDVGPSDASEVVALTTTIDAAVADGDVIEVDLMALYKSDNAFRSVQFDALYGGVEATMCTEGVNAGNTEYKKSFTFRFIRKGSHMWAGAVEGMEGSGNWNKDDVWVQLTSPTFTAGQTLSIKCTLSASKAALHFKPQAGVVRLVAGE